MIEGCGCPCRLGVAFGAGCGELGRFMIWIFRLIELSYMTSGAGIRGIVIVAIMAISAGKRYV